ncbi:MAG: Fe-S-cluster-containing hydrogenase component 2, HycB [Candidatus Methanohalarchaeum thermophilum]|uniref:Fe-S-cluster-containing hydrogenase component 2, HycB n=1 Tax=Methanohalarchaeum thermophilum TaxID=1903181 RepID=A0A1Q6DWV5_METT1|nr:MAG: Fe-S-cluster-containing hydrogenase component 2, HycB [Candidatus Methanohalarchaeum thermophilum]
MKGKDIVEGENEEGESKLSRRNLLKVIAAGGAAATVGVSGCTQQQQGTTTKYACPYCDKEFEDESELRDHINEAHSQEAGQISRSAALVWTGKENCHGCRVCEVACSIHKEGEANPDLSRMNVKWDPFDSGDLIEGLTCKQCDSPECYYACPIEGAMYIDEETGARCIDSEKCTGCGDCVEACPFNPSPIKMDVDKKVAFKCDLCKDKDGDPACLEACPLSGSALKLVEKDERENYEGL